MQEEFQKEYPFLKLEFYRYPLKSKNHSRKPQPISGDLPIAMARREGTEGALDIDQKRSVEEIETDLNIMFGLHVEILRRSANMWIKTSLTHHWSLGHQNLEGKQMSLA